MPARLQFLIPTLLLAVLLLLAPQCPAQETTTLDTVENRIAELEASGAAPTALATYREASTALTQAAELASAATDFQTKTDQVPERLRQARLALETSPSSAGAADPATLTLPELEEKITATRAALDQARTTLSRLESEAESNGLRATSLPVTATRLSDQLTELENTLAATPALAPDAPHETLAAYASQLAEKNLLRQTIETNNYELAYIAQVADLNSAERALATRDINQLTSRANTLQSNIDTRRLKQAESDAQQAKIEADTKSGIPALTAIKEENLALAGRRTGTDGLTARILRANTALADVSSTYELITDQYRNAKRRIDLVSQGGFDLFSPTVEETAPQRETTASDETPQTESSPPPERQNSIGGLLRAERDSLPEIATIRASLRKDLQENSAAGLTLIRFEKQRRDLLATTESQIQDIFDQLPPDSDEQQTAAEADARRLKLRTAAEAEARRLIETQRNLLDQLINDYRTLTSTIGRTNLIRRDLIARTIEYTNLIDERVLWFRSAPVIDKVALAEGWSSLDIIYSPDTWQPFSKKILRDLTAALPLWIAATLATVLLTLRRRVYKLRISAAAKIAARNSCTTFAPTAKALVYTTLLSLPVPIVLGFVAQRHGDIGTGGVATGLWEVACQILVLGFLRHSCKPNGLAPAHFRLASPKAKALHRFLTYVIVVGVPISFVFGILDSPEGHAGGRLIFIATMLAFASVVFLILRRSRTLVLSSTARAAVVLIAVVTPTIFALGAAAGFFYTVRELQWRLEASVVLSLVVLLATSITTRWFLVARRRIAIDQARSKRRAAAAAAKAEVTSLTPEEIEATAVDITKIKDQTGQLLRSAAVVTLAVGLWGIWSQVLPALNILDDVHLWPDTTELASAAPQATTISEPANSSSPTDFLSFGAPSSDSTGSSPAGKDTAEPSPPPAPDTTTVAPPQDPNFGWVTLADVALSLLTFVLTYIAAKNIPGLLDISLLRRLDLKPGGSFAITASARYLIVLVGIIFAFSQIGITWSKVQWIAAAVTVGIGFGLQEVFANFVAGLILLFERPIRIGDFVTVGTTSGQVTRIEIRATTIKDFSNKELVVPNKEFITGQLVNWTLTDSVIRVEIPVGIAYGSDTELARTLLEKVGDDHPLTNNDPAAQAVFLAFGASSLDFELRVHIDSVKNLIPVRNDLHFAIDRAFREHGVEIAFPQTDIHIRSMPEKTSPQPAQPAPPDSP